MLTPPTSSSNRSADTAPTHQPEQQKLRDGERAALQTHHTKSLLLSSYELMSPLQRGTSRGRFLLPLPRLELLPPPPALGLGAQLSRDRPADTTPPPLPLPLPDTAGATNTGRTGPPRPPEPAAWAAPPDPSADAATTEGGDGEEDKDEEAEVTEEAAEEPGLVPAEPDPAWRLPDIVTPSPPAGRSEERDRDPPPPPPLPPPQCILRTRAAPEVGLRNNKVDFCKATTRQRPTGGGGGN